VGTLGSTFASQGARESALAINNAFQYHVHRRLELDPALKPMGPLPAVDQRDESVEAFRRGKLENGVLEEDFALSLATGTLDTETYGKFAEKAHRIDDGFQAATRVTREPHAVRDTKPTPARPPAKKR
jgi:hypothetical protein